MDFSGKVVSGLKIGQKFGIATANISVTQIPDLKHGVYLVQVKKSNQADLPINGIMHFGELKTFGREFTIEIHLLDFTNDIYGEHLKINVLKFCRETQTFQNADELFSQIETDIIKAKKFFLRQKIYTRWHSLSNQQKEILNQKSLAAISKNTNFVHAQSIYLYAPETHREIDFSAHLMTQFPDKIYSFPKVEDKNLIFKTVSKFTDLIPGKFGILEPDEAKENAPAADLIFVPAVAADAASNRLGKGGGFYDQFLGKFRNVPKIVVLPDFAIVKEIPTESHDLKIDKTIRINFNK